MIMVFPPAWGPLAVKVAAQLADSAVPDSLHGLLPLKLPGPLGKKLTVPVGLIGGPLKASVTVAVHVVDRRMATVSGEQVTLVRVGCPTTTVTV